MANIKKFKDPVLVQIRMEKKLKEAIIENFGNITDFLNTIAKQRLEKEVENGK